jgi:hypothetical protein
MTAALVDDAGRVESVTKGRVEVPGTAFATAVRTGEERRHRPRIVESSIAVIPILSKPPRHVFRYRNESRLSELAMPNSQHLRGEIYIFVPQAEGLPAAQAGHKERPQSCPMNKPAWLGVRVISERCADREEPPRLLTRQNPHYRISAANAEEETLRDKRLGKVVAYESGEFSHHRQAMRSGAVGTACDEAPNKGLGDESAFEVGVQGKAIHFEEHPLLVSIGVS